MAYKEYTSVWVLLNELMTNKCENKIIVSLFEAFIEDPEDKRFCQFIKILINSETNYLKEQLKITVAENISEAYSIEHILSEGQKLINKSMDNENENST